LTLLPVDRIADNSSPCDVILNGGEAAVRDRTTAGAFDVVGWNSLVAHSVLALVDAIASVSPAYGLSERYRPPQDDNSLVMTATTPLSKYPTDG
jgi:hypothetical protein